MILKMKVSVHLAVCSPAIAYIAKLHFMQFIQTNVYLQNQSSVHIH